MIKSLKTGPINTLYFDQPAGNFLLAVMNVSDIIKISKSNPRMYDGKSMMSIGGIQRELSKKRVKDIANYSSNVDATFPTPILLGLSEQHYKLGSDNITIIGEEVADVVDGQHRIEGIKESGNMNFMLPVVFILNATEEQKALMFATINGKQTKVPASIIYDLFNVMKDRSPQKTSHEIARTLNKMPDSPWYRRLKMLGKKAPSDPLASLSQGTFVKSLIGHITKDADKDRNLIKEGKPPLKYDNCVFNDYFLNKKDDVILKILLNFFLAMKTVWPEEWENPDNSILTKAIGFEGFMKALPYLIPKGKEKGTLKEQFFVEIFLRVKEKMDKNGTCFTSKHFDSGAMSQAQIRDMILAAMK